MEKRNEISDVVDALYQIMIAVQSLNPDPTKTIAQHQREQKGQSRRQKLTMVAALIAAVAAVGNLVYTLVR